MRAAFKMTGILGLSALVVACASPSAMPLLTTSQLAGTWRVISVNGGSAEQGPVTIQFGEDGRASGNASCNQYSAEYKLDGSSLAFGKAIATMKACPDMELEQRFLATLADVDHAEIAPDGSLVLHARNEGRIVARRG